MRHILNHRSKILFGAVLLAALMHLSSCEERRGSGAGRTIEPGNVDSIELIQVDHPYLGSRVGRKILEKKYWAEFLHDFADKREELVKFYSCYVIKIHMKGQPLLSYRTNGQLFEVFKDDSAGGRYFKLNQDTNLVTKYWGIREAQFCDTAGQRP